MADSFQDRAEKGYKIGSDGRRMPVSSDDSRPINFLDVWLAENPSTGEEAQFQKAAGLDAARMADAPNLYAGFEAEMEEIERELPEDLRNKDISQFNDGDLFRCGVNKSIGKTASLDRGEIVPVPVPSLTRRPFGHGSGETVVSYPLHLGRANEPSYVEAPVHVSGKPLPPTPKPIPPVVPIENSTVPTQKQGSSEDDSWIQLAQK